MPGKTEHSTLVEPISQQTPRAPAKFSFRRVGAVAARIVRQFVRDRRSLGLLFFAPLLVLTLLQLVLNDASSQATLGIVPPSGPAGDAIVSQMRQRLNQQGQTGLTLVVVARAQVDATLKAGDADGVLIFPPDYFPGDGSGLTLRLEGSNPTVARQLISTVALLDASLTSQTSPGIAPSTPQPPTLTTSYLYAGPAYTATDALAPLLVGLFAFFFVFILTSVAFLRERSQGTVERLLVSPLSKAELVLGYVGGFMIFAMAQSLVILLYVIYVLRVHYAGNLGLLLLVTIALTIGGVNMGIFASAFARTELQVIQFIPILLVPQILLGGMFWAVKALPPVLQQLAYVMPLTYANFALKDVMLKGFGIAEIWPDLLALVAFAVLMVVAAALSLRQENI